MSENLSEFKAFAQRFIVENQRFFNGQGEIFVARAPGRLDVMGGIADYSGSLVLEMPIEEAATTAVQLDPTPTLQIISLRADEEISTFSMPLADLLNRDGAPIEYAEGVRYFGKTAVTQWAAYFAGTFLVLMREKRLSFEQGAKILIKSAVPEGKGVSSSAAIEVATMLAICKAYDIELEPTELATLCQIVENRVANAPCGIMDQMTVVHGQKEKLLALLCQPATIQSYVDIPPRLKFWGIDSGIRHAVSGSDYGAVRVGAFMGLKMIQTIRGNSYDGYLANLTPSLFEQHYRAKLPDSILGSDFLEQFGDLPDTVTTVDPNRTYAVRQPTAHPIYEHFRVQLFTQLLMENTKTNNRLLGELMFQSHASYSACGLGSSGTDLLVSLVQEDGIGQGLFGAKITGGGSGGTVVILGRHDAQNTLVKIAKRYQAETGYQPVIFAGSSDGASEQMAT